jgi:methylglyoxal synthase
MLKSDLVKKTIALIAHDGKKAEMVNFALEHQKTIAKFNLVATGTTAKCIEEKIGLKVHRYFSGPMGGDIEIAAGVLAGKIHAVFFFINPLDPHPHDPDIHALIRACNIYNVPIATNCATAELIMLTCSLELNLTTSPLLARALTSS